MPYEELKDQLRGVSFTTPVPFTADGDEVLYDECAQLTRAIVDAGGRSIIPCGNTGEYYSLTDEERRGLVETTVDVVDDGAVIAGVGGSTETVIERLAEYESAGADGVMIHGPDHTYAHRCGLVDYYKRIADATDLGVVLYKRGPALSLPVVSELSEIDNVVGLKFAVNDVNAFSRAVRRVPGDTVFTTGNAERFAPAYALEGAEGFTTGIGSVVPEAPLALQAAIERKNWERALAIRDLIRPYEALREEPGADNELGSANNVPAVKYGLELAGQYGGPVREPLVELSEADKQRVETYYERLAGADLLSETLGH